MGAEDYMVRKYLTQIIIAGLSILLTSCYSNYVYLKNEINFRISPVYKYGDSTKIAFVSAQRAYRRASGISAFPDGGQSKDIFYKESLYVYDVKEGSLVCLKDISNEHWHRAKRRKLLFIDNQVFYQAKIDMQKVSDTAKLLSLKQQHEKCYSININTNEIRLVDMAHCDSLYQKYYSKQKVDLSKLRKLPLVQWGLVIQDIYPKSDEEYIDETIYLKNGSRMSRRAVIEQIISKLDKKEIKLLLKKMEDYKNNLEGLEKKEYEIYSEEVYKSIQKLL